MDAPRSPEVLEFIMLYLEHQRAGVVHELGYYQARFPGSEAEVEREFRKLSRPSQTQGASGPELLPSGRRPASVEGLHFGPYHVLRELGRGGQGVVYLAEDRAVDRPVALKLLPDWRLPDQATLLRFRREAEVLSRLEHPSICTVFQAELAAETPYIAMRFVDGASLDQALVARRTGAAAGLGSLAERARTLLGPTSKAALHDLLGFFVELARAVHFAHEQGVIHRDLKPSNVMLDEEGVPVILDFGLAREEHPVGRGVTRTGTVLGTPEYMAPEQVRGEHARVGRSTDVWALGVMLVECLTLELPFDGTSHVELFRAITGREPRDVRAANPLVSRDLKAVLERALHKDPSRRYATAQALAEELERVARDEPVRARPVGPLTKAGRWSRRNPGLAGLGAGVLVSLVVLLFVLNALLLTQRQNALARRDQDDRATLAQVRALGHYFLEDFREPEPRIRAAFAHFDLSSPSALAAGLVEFRERRPGDHPHLLFSVYALSVSLERFAEVRDKDPTGLKPSEEIVDYTSLDALHTVFLAALDEPAVDPVTWRRRIWRVRHGKEPMTEAELLAFIQSDALPHCTPLDLLWLHETVHRRFEGLGDESRQYLDRAVEEDPGLLPALLKIGILELGSEESLAVLRNARAVDKDVAITHFLIGFNHFSFGRRAEGEAALRRALSLEQLGPSNTRTAEMLLAEGPGGS